MSRLDDLVALLQARSVTTGHFTLASGRDSSYYIDARQTTMSAKGLDLVGYLGLRSIRRAGWDAELIGGLTVGADPVAYAIAAASRRAPPELDAFTVRKEPKRHGTGRRIDGCFRHGAAVVVVEDVVTTGQSALQAMSAVRQEGATVLGVFAVVDREEGGRGAIEAQGVQLRTLVSLADLGLAPARNEDPS